MVIAGLVTGFGYAAEVSSDDALCAVKGWVSLKESLDKSIDGNPASVETYTGRSGKGKFYVVTLEGGGYVVASGDDPCEGRRHAGRGQCPGLGL